MLASQYFMHKIINKSYIAWLGDTWTWARILPAGNLRQASQGRSPTDVPSSFWWAGGLFCEKCRLLGSKKAVVSPRSAIRNTHMCSSVPYSGIGRHYCRRIMDSFMALKRSCIKTFAGFRWVLPARKSSLQSLSKASVINLRPNILWATDSFMPASTRCR